MGRPADTPRICGWYVDLPWPASAARRAAAASSPLERAATLAQACLYLYDREGFGRAVAGVERGPQHLVHLADALTADHAVRCGDFGAARDALARLAHAPPEVRAWAGLREADILERVGQHDAAARLLAAPWWDERAEPALLRPLVVARLHFRHGAVREAVASLEAAGPAASEAPRPLAAAYHRTLAVHHGVAGDAAAALHHHRLALDAFRRLGDELMLAKEYLSLAQGYQEGDELDHADFFLRKAAELVEQFGDRRLDGLLASRLGMLALTRGETEAARQHFERDVEASADVPHAQGFARRNLGKVLLRLGRPQQARDRLRESVTGFAAISDRFNEHLSRLEAVSADLACGDDLDADAAERELVGVVAYLRGIGRTELLPQVEAVRARLTLRQGRVELARSTMTAAGQALLAQRRPERLIEALLLFAEACTERDELGVAMEMLAWGYREAMRAGRPGLSAMVLERIGRIDERAVLDLSAASPATPERTATAAQFERFLLASRSSAARMVVEEALRVAPTDETVLIEGETGVGKGVLARFVHASSARGSQELVALNCGAIPESLLESELFGHEKGAFTGAESRRIGVLEAASGGTVFLDEVGELSSRAQVTLLRFLEDRRVRPVGSSVSRPVDVRVVAATNRHLLEEVRAGTFRQDLYYRLAAYPIRLPPLRERLDDLPELVRFILERTPEAQRKGITSVSKGALVRLRAHPWPGNLRELDNVIRAATIRCQGKRILERDLPPTLDAVLHRGGAFPTLEEVQRRHVREALRLARGNKSRAALLLGVHRNTLRAWLKDEA